MSQHCWHMSHWDAYRGAFLFRKCCHCGQQEEERMVPDPHHGRHVKVVMNQWQIVRAAENPCAST